MKQPIYNTALYLRLSRDDEQQGDSGSIQTQRMMLRDYAQTHGLNVVSEYVDDGWSGTNYDRPGFQKMIDDIEDGKINCVVTKDLSRLGRNYIMTGQYTEIYFPSKGVRYIAVNDNVDTLNGESELAPFLNILNEMHARQTSKKVKAALKARRMNGAHISSFAPLGYRWDPEQKGHLLVDPETKWIVEKIFDMAVHGMGAAKIMKALIREKVPTPGYIYYVREGAYAHIYQNAPEKARYAWNETKIRLILTDENYLGNSIHNKTSVKSFKLKKQTRNPTSEWVRVEGTHEAIVSRDVFDQVQKQIVSRRRQRRDGTTQIFAGLVKCADCGWTMHFARQNKGNHLGYFSCGTYSKKVDECTMHFISYNTLYAYVLERLQFWSSMAQKDERQLLERLLQNGDKGRQTERKKREAELRKAEKRRKTVNDLFVKMYEDWSTGRITESNFNLLSERYQVEQAELDEKISSLKLVMEDDKQSAEDAEKWVKLIRQYSEITELDAPLLNTLIEKILVHEGKRGPDGIREQEVEIFYRFAGKIDI